jgi:hypothetical protein
MTDQRGRHGKQPRGSAHGRWNREKLISSHGYVKVRVGADHPLADPNGYAYEHLLVWVSARRKRPGRDEVLRFRNGDKLDTRLENLLLVSRADHNRMKNEGQMRDDQGRVLSKAVTRLVRAGAATVRTVRR